MNTDPEICPHYFVDEDQVEINTIFTSINNNDKRNDYRETFLVQVYDSGLGLIGPRVVRSYKAAVGAGS